MITRDGQTPRAVSRLLRAVPHVAWAEAYPLDVFPAPDLARARVALEAAGMSLDAISASAMRHVIAGVGKIAREALE